jgi:hypothetical protein
MAYLFTTVAILIFRRVFFIAGEPSSIHSGYSAQVQSTVLQLLYSIAYSTYLAVACTAGTVYSTKSTVNSTAGKVYGTKISTTVLQVQSSVLKVQSIELQVQQYCVNLHAVLQA